MHVDNCTNCGQPLFSKKEEETTPPVLDDLFDDTGLEDVEQELADLFSVAFRKRLEEEHTSKKHQAYADRFLESEFKSSVDFRIKQLAEEARSIGLSKLKKSGAVASAFEELIDYFIIRFCNDLNETVFSENILKYQGLEKDKINVGEMVFDYLDFEIEDETLYTDFVAMPAHKLKNAANSYLNPKKSETLFFICDGSVLGSCKEGFAMTNEAIYWKMPFESPQRVFYKKVKSVRREEDWITINGIFFNSSKSLNLKLLRLLKKLSG